MYVHHVAAPIHDTSRPRQRVRRPLDISPLCFFFRESIKASLSSENILKLCASVINKKAPSTSNPTTSPRQRGSTQNVKHERTKKRKAKERRKRVQSARKRNGVRQINMKGGRKAPNKSDMWLVTSPCYGPSNRYTLKLVITNLLLSECDQSDCLLSNMPRVELIRVSVLGARCHYSTSCEAKCFVSPVMFYTAHHPNELDLQRKWESPWCVLCMLLPSTPTNLLIVSQEIDIQLDLRSDRETKHPTHSTDFQWNQKNRAILHNLCISLVRALILGFSRIHWMAEYSLMTRVCFIAGCSWRHRCLRRISAERQVCTCCIDM